MPRLTKEVREVAAFAASLSEEFLQCRELGHQWRPHRAEYLAKYRAYERSLLCRRCGTERHQRLSTGGAVLSSGYTYPDGYAHEGGRITGEGRDRLRLESVMRVIEPADDEREAG